MLVLSRGVDQTIKIGKDVVIMVTAIGDKKVSLGVTAPKDQLILRGELEPKENPSGDKSK